MCPSIGAWVYKLYDFPGENYDVIKKQVKQAALHVLTGDDGLDVLQSEKLGV